MIYGLIEPGRKLSEAYLTEAKSAKEALLNFGQNFPHAFYNSAHFFVKFNDFGTVAHDMRILKYIRKKRSPLPRMT